MKKIENLFVLRMQKMFASLRDHLHLIFKSAAHNHLRIQQIRRGEHGGVFCTLSFYSFTELKRYQKKVRVFSFGLTSGLAMFLVALVLVPVFFDPSGSKAAGGPTISSITPNSGLPEGGTSVTITGTNFSIPDSYTKLLMHSDGSGNSFIDSSSATPKTISANGNTTQSATQSKFGGKSAYFNGGSDFLTTANSSDWNFGSGDFTVDWWEYRTAVTEYGAIVARDSGSVPPFLFGYSNSGTETVYMSSNGSSWDIASNVSMGAVAAGGWHHLAVVRNGNSFYTFRDGVVVSTWTSSLAVASSSNPLVIGRFYSYAPISAYIDELRISKGIARWTSNFSASLPSSPYFQPMVTFGGLQATEISSTNGTTITAKTPTHTAGAVDVVVTNSDSQSATSTNGFTYAELMPSVSSINPISGPTTGGTSVTITGANFLGGVDSNTKLLVHADGAGASFSDSSLTPKTITVNGDSTQSTAQSKFGGSSAYFDGTGDYLTAPSSSDFDFASGDYTVDFWVKVPTLQSAFVPLVMFGKSWAGDNQSQWIIGLSSANKIEATHTNSSGVASYVLDSSVISANTWYHIAAVRSGGVITIYKNGTSIGTMNVSTSYALQAGWLLSIGGESELHYARLNGYIDEVRITKGSAIWTSNFTVPDSKYAPTASVYFGSTQSSGVQFVNSTTIRAATPAHAVGYVNVAVTNYDSQSATLSNAYTFIATPTISSVSPSSGYVTGGDLITISGTNFYGSPAVTLGGTSATSVTLVNENTITAIVPAHIAGQVNVVVTNPDSQSATLTNGFTFNELPPSISSINPNSGPITGGTNVTILGSNFFSDIDSNTKLLLHGDGVGNTFIDSSLSPKTIIASGSASQSTSQSKFGGSGMYFNGTNSYLNVANSTDWAFGTGNFTIDFWVNFSSMGGLKTFLSSNDNGVLQFGYNTPQYPDKLYIYTNTTHYPATVTSTFNPGQWYHIAAVRSSGQVSYYINGQIVGALVAIPVWSDPGNFRIAALESGYYLNGYLDEFRVSNVARWTGNFNPPASAYNYPTLSIGGLSATNIQLVNSSTITAITPAHLAGATDVVMTNPDAQSSTLSNGFTYVGPPTVTTINPSSANNNQSISGIVISGTGFQSGATVKFKKSGEADVTCSNVVFNSSTSFSCDGDFHGKTPGNWDVQVTNADGQIGTGSGILTIVGEVTQINFATPTYTIKPNVATQAIRVQLRDSAGRATKPNSDAVIDLSKSSLTGEFSLSKNSWTPINNITFTTSDDTKTVYYKDSVLGSYTIGAAENPSNNWTDASQNITISNNAPFVWPFDTSNDYQYDGAKVDISNSDANLSDLSAVNPEIKNTSSAALTYSSLSSFSEVLDSDNQGSTKYQLSNNDGTTWYWWNGSTWAATTQTVAQANDATTINAHISTFNSAIGQIGNAKLSFKAFLIGNGTQKVSLDSIFVGYALFPYKYSFIQKPVSLNETEEGTFVVQAQDQNGNVITFDHDTIVTLSSSTPATGFFATDLNEDISTRWDKTSVVILAGQNSATFYYKDSLKGNKTISANPPGGESTVAASYGLTIKSKYRFLVTGVSDPIKAGVPSSVTVQTADYLGNPMTDYTGTIHFSSSDSVANLPSDNALTAPMLGSKTYVNGVTMMTQAEQCVTVTDASDSNITGSQCSITVTAPPAGVASKLKLVSAPQFVPVGETSSSITVQLQDINGESAVKATPTTVYVYRTTASGQFSANGSTGWTSGAFSVTIPAGATSTNFFYKDTVIGNYTLTVSDDAVEGQDLALTNDIQQLAAVSGNPHGFSFNSGSAIITAGASSGALNFSLHDSLGNQVTTQINQTAIITSSNGGEFSLNGSSNWTSKLVTNIAVGSYENNFYYRNNISGTDSITISDSDPADGNTGLDDVSATLTINSSSAAQFVFLNSPVNLNVGETSSQMTIQARDIFGNVSPVGSDLSVYLYSSDANTSFSSLASPFVSVNHITIPTGSSTSSFYFKQSVDNGPITITASDNAVAPDGAVGISDATQNETISQGAVTSFVITNISPLNVNAGAESSAITVESRNPSGVAVPMSADTTIYFHTDSSATLKEFSLNQSPSWNGVSLVNWPAGNDSLTFYYKDTKSGSKTITVGDDALITNETGITNATLAVQVSPLETSQIKFVSSPLTVEAGERGQLTIQAQDQFGNSVLVDSNTVVNLSSDNVDGIFSNANGDTITSATILSGNSNVQIYYKNDNVSSQSLSIASSGLTGDSQDFEIVAGAPVVAKLSIVDSNLTAGSTSGRIQAKFYNSHDVLTTTPANIFINISGTSSTRKFDTSPDGTFTSSSLNLAILAGSNSTSFYYKDTKAGAYAIKSNGNGLNEFSLDINVQAAQIDHLKFTSASQIITAGEISSAITGKIYDAYENEITLTGNLSLSLSSNSGTGEFSLAASPWNNVTSVNVASGQNSFSFFYKDSIANLASITVTSQYGAITQSESIIEGQIQNDAPAKLLFQSSPQTLIINSASTFSFYLANSADQYTVAQSEVTADISSNSLTGRFYNGSSWVSTLQIVFEAGESVKSFQYKDSANGNPTIMIAATGLISALQQQTVINGSIEKLVLEAQDTANTIDRIPVTIRTMTNTDLPVAVSSDKTIALAQNGSGHFYADAVTQDQINSALILAGNSSRTIYFQQTTPGNVTINVDENPSLGWTAAQKEIVISSIPTRLKFATSAQTKQAGSDSDEMTVRLEDIFGNVSNAAADKTLHLSTSSSFGHFSMSNSNWSNVSSIVMSAGTNSISFYYRDTLAGTNALTVSDVSSPAENPDTGFVNASQSFIVTADDIYSLNILSSENNLEIGQVSPLITVQARDQYGNAKIVEADTNVYMYSSSTNGKFSLSTNFSDSNLISSAKILAGNSTVSFYYRDLQTGNFQITVSDKSSLDNPDSGIINDSQSVSVITGSVAKIVWETLPSTIEEGDSNASFVVKTTNSSGIEIPSLVDLTLHLSAGYTSSGLFSLDPNGTWGISTLTISTGQSRATFYYKDTVSGSPLIVVSDELNPIGNDDTGLTNAGSYVNIVQGAITKMIFTSTEQTVIANHPSLVFHIQTVNKSNVATEISNDKIIYLRSSSASGEFSSDGLNWGSNGVVIAAGNYVGSFYYRDASSGTYTLTAADNLPLSPDTNWTNATQSVIISPQQLDHFNVRNISDPQKQGTPSSIVISPVDGENYVIKEYAGTITEVQVLDADGNPESAILPEVPYTFVPNVDKGIKTFTNSVAFFSSGEKTVTIKDNNGFIGSQQGITVLAASVNPIAKVRFIDTESPLTVVKKEASSLITVQIQDSSGEPVNASLVSGYDLKIVSSSDAAEFSIDGTNWSSKEIVLNVKQYTNFATFYYRNSNKVDDVLIAMDWDGATDNSSISNDTLNVDVTASEAAYLEITGANSQTAGIEQEITITAKDEDGDVATSYDGNKDLLFAGANEAITGQKPSCTDKDGSDIEFGQLTTLNFVDGEAKCNLKLYRKEIAQIKTEAGSINTYGDSARDLSVNVAANIMDRNLSVLSVTPNPQQTGAAVVANVLPKDAFGNIAGQSNQIVAMNVAGANNITGQQFVFDDNTGNYQTTYIPQNPGNDIVSATLNGQAIKQDTEGISDGIVHEKIEGNALNSTCNFITLNDNESENGKLVFDTCIGRGETVKSNELSKSSTKGTSVSQIGLVAEKDVDNFSDAIRISSSLEKPSGMTISSAYLDDGKYATYGFWEIKTDGDRSDINKSTFRIIIPKQWIDENSIANIFALDGNENILIASQTDSSSDNVTFEITANKLPEYLVLIGQKTHYAQIDQIDESSDALSVINPKPTNIIEYAINSPVVVAVNDAISDDNVESGNMVSNGIANLFGIDRNKAIEITNMLAIISTGAAAASAGAATAASFPILSYVLGGLRSASAVPYRRKQKWGVVYDSQTGKPLGSALVIISDFEGKVKEMKNTDAMGFYSFLAPQGTYVIEVRKSGYVPAENSHIISFETYYDNSYICGEKIELEQEEIISLNIPMLKQEETLLQKVFNPSTLTHAVFWLGFMFSIVAVVLNHSYLNIAIVIFFIISFFFNVFYRSTMGTGKVLNSQMKPVGFATVKIYDKIDGKLLARTVANERGLYTMIMNEGDYIIEAQSGTLKSRKEISLSKHKEINDRLILNEVIL